MRPIVSTQNTAQTPALKRKSGQVHPESLMSYSPKTPLPKLDCLKITAQTSYKEFAWEFLRRNRFYQHAYDQTAPAYELNSWGYRPSEEHEAHFGLVELVDYQLAYKDAGCQWQPLAELDTRIKESINIFQKAPKGGQAKIVEYPKSQVAIVFDLAPTFGDSSESLQMQCKVVLQELEKLIPNKNEKTEAAENAKKNDPKESKLSKKTLLSLLASADKSQAKSSSEYEHAEKAFDYIYSWELLRLLTLED